MAGKKGNGGLHIANLGAGIDLDGGAENASANTSKKKKSSRVSFIRISPHQIISVSRVQSRRKFDPENSISDKQLMESIRLEGIQTEPGVSLLSSEGNEKTYRLVYGYRRSTAAKLLDLPRITVKLFPETETEETLDRKTLIENEQREDLSPIEKATGFKMYLDLHPDATQKDLSESIGLSSATVSRYIKVIEKGSPKLLNMVGDRVIEVFTANKMVDFKDDELDAFIVERAKGFGVDEIIKKITNARKSKGGQASEESSSVTDKEGTAKKVPGKKKPVVAVNPTLALVFGGDEDAFIAAQREISSLAVDENKKGLQSLLAAGSKSGKRSADDVAHLIKGMGHTMTRDVLKAIAGLDRLSVHLDDFTKEDRDLIKDAIRTMLAGLK